MQIRIYAHEIEYCGVTPEDVCGATISNDEVTHICKTLNIKQYVEEWEYDDNANELILYINCIN